MGTHLFITFEHQTFKSIRTAVARNIAENFEIATIVRYVKDPINWMLHNLNFSYVFRPVLWFSLWEWKIRKSSIIIMSLLWALQQFAYHSHSSFSLFQAYSDSVYADLYGNFFLLGILLLVLILEDKKIINQDDKTEKCLNNLFSVPKLIYVI